MQRRVPVARRATLPRPYPRPLWRSAPRASRSVGHHATDRALVLPQFYDDIFDALYLDRTEGNPRLVPLHQV